MMMMVMMMMMMNRKLLEEVYLMFTRFLTSDFLNFHRLFLLPYGRYAIIKLESLSQN